jgi:hypothetical protein
MILRILGLVLRSFDKSSVAFHVWQANVNKRQIEEGVFVIFDAFF